MKICTRCKIEKELERFWVRKDRKSGRNHICNDCLNAVKREKNKENPEKNRERCRKWNEENKEKRKETYKKYIENLSEEQKEKKKLRKNTWYKKNREKQIQVRSQQKHKVVEWQKEYNKKLEKEKLMARKLVSRELERGNIFKPKECSICGSDKYKIQGHHEDYSKPLEVIWVCTFCHSAIHKLLKKR